MCILIVLRDRIEGYPLLVGSNRDEDRSRPWEPPCRDGEILAPRDRKAGGTWIALADSGLLVAVTNRPDPTLDPTRPSRGLLTLDAARAGTVAAARELLVDETFHAPRNAFQMLVADATDAWIVLTRAKKICFMEEHPLPPGLHTLTNRMGLDELDHGGALDALDVPAGTPLDRAIDLLKAALATHADPGPDGPDEICKHGADRGTLSSTIVALPAPGSGNAPVFLFAGGPPCTTPFAPA